MALKKDVETILSGATAPAAGETTLGACTELDLDTALQVEIEVQVTYGATATAGVVARVWAAASTGEYTTAPIDEYALPFGAGAGAGATMRISFQTRASPRFMKVTVQNEDPAVAATGVSVTATVQTA